LSAQEVAEGIARATAACALRDASAELSAEADVAAIKGLTEVAAAEAMRAPA
jgi:hypothetical protein